jgi:hypothetical protein
MTRDEQHKLNKELGRQNREAFDILPGPSSINLRRIDISENKRLQKDNHPEIDPDRMYLVFSGCWKLAWPSKQWFGWTFHLGSHSVQLSHLDMLFETDLPKLPRALVPYNREVVDEDNPDHPAYEDPYRYHNEDEE